MNKTEFKARWESGETGGGITFDDVAECAKKWGLFARPRTARIKEKSQRSSCASRNWKQRTNGCVIFNVLPNRSHQ